MQTDISPFKAMAREIESDWEFFHFEGVPARFDLTGTLVMSTDAVRGLSKASHDTVVEIRLEPGSELEHFLKHDPFCRGLILLLPGELCDVYEVVPCQNPLALVPYMSPMAETSVG